MKKANREILNKDYISDQIKIIATDREIKKQGGYIRLDFTENEISWKKLKAMYEKRVEICRELEAELRERSKPRNVLKPGDPQYELYREIIKEMLIKLLSNQKVNRVKLIDEIIKQKKYPISKSKNKKIGELYFTFDKWKRDNPETYEKLITEELYKLYPDISTF